MEFGILASGESVVWTWCFLLNHLITSWCSLYQATFSFFFSFLKICSTLLICIQTDTRQRQQQQQTSRTSSVTKQQPVVPQQPSNPKIHRQQSTNTSPPERPIQAQEPTKSGAPTPPASPKPPPVSTALATVPGEGEMLKNVDVANGIDKEDPIPSLQETPVEDAIRVMRSRLRKRVAPSSG